MATTAAQRRSSAATTATAADDDEGRTPFRPPLAPSSSPFFALPPWALKVLTFGTATAVSFIAGAVLRDVAPTLGLTRTGLAWFANHIISESGLRTLLGPWITPSVVVPSGGGGTLWCETVAFPPAPVARRAVLSVVLWVPFFSGAVLATAKCLFQVSAQDTVSTARQRSVASQVENGRYDPFDCAATSSAPAADSSVLERREPSVSARPTASSPQQQQQQDFSPFGLDSPPARRLDLADESSSYNTTAVPTPRESLGRGENMPLPARATIPRLGLPALGAASDDDPALSAQPAALTSSSPTSASARELDSVTLAIVTACSLVDLNAFLTAACKYYVRNVVVPHGNAKRTNGASSPTVDTTLALPRSAQKQLVGSTPRDLVQPLPQRLAHVTRRTLEFIGRFQRNVNLCEVSEHVEVSEFLRENGSELHDVGESGSEGAAVVTVAIHRHPVPGAVRLIDFEHPESAAYCFAKSASPGAGSPVASGQRTASFGSPVAPRSADSSFGSTTSGNGAAPANAADEFGSPLTATAYARHVATRPSEALEERVPEDDALNFCAVHVYLSGSTQHNTLASTVNMVLYDRAAKRRRAKYASVAAAPAEETE